MDGFEQKVRERAYQIWLAAGMGDGMDLEHWCAAEQDVKVAAVPAKAVRAKVAAKPAAVKAKAAPAKAKLAAAKSLANKSLAKKPAMSFKKPAPLSATIN